MCQVPGGYLVEIVAGRSTAAHDAAGIFVIAHRAQTMQVPGLDNLQVFLKNFGVVVGDDIGVIDLLDKDFFFFSCRLTRAFIEFHHGCAAFFQYGGFIDGEVAAAADAARKVYEIIKGLFRLKTHVFLILAS